jgi:HB1, ASXL, restriction endonuclease HTH domain/Restriction endonuclease
MTFTEAAAEVLRLAGKPLHYKEITELAIEKNLLSHVGKSPEVTMGARLAALLKKEDKTNPIVRVKPGVFALRDWDEKGKGKKGAAKAQDAVEDDGEEINALEVEAAQRESMAPPPRAASNDDDDDDRPIVSGEDALRADLAARGAELFDDEDDDDQPIFAAPGSAGSASSTAAGSASGVPASADGTDGRRRRRRRRRGRGGAAEGDRASSPRLPGITTTTTTTSTSDRDRAGAYGSDGQIQPNAIISLDNDSNDSGRDPLAPPPRPMIRDRQQIMAGGAPSGIDVPLGEGEELAGRDLADATMLILSSCDRGAGAVPVRSLVDALMRRGRLAGDPALAAIQLSASLRADNLRRTADGKRARFRFSSGGRVAPTDWALGSDLARLEADVIAAVERYREGARRMMLRRLQELPGQAFLELALLGLERIGMTQIRPVRRAGSPGGEAHFAAVHRTGTDEIRTAIVLRKDGREIGRERVSDVRGALHHYGPAVSGWLVTTGQVLSGAREEAATPNAAPIALFDGLALCKLLEDHDIAVVKSRFPIAIPDLELLENLRG